MWGEGGAGGGSGPLIMSGLSGFCQDISEKFSDSEKLCSVKRTEPKLLDTDTHQEFQYSV